MESDLKKSDNLPEKCKWYFKGSTLIVAFFVVGPLILPAVWLNPHFSRRKKIVFTVLCIAFTLLLFKLTALATKFLYSQIQLMQS